MKRCIAAIISICTVFICLSLSVNAYYSDFEATTKITEAKINQDFKEKLAAAEETDIFNVTIELKDTIDINNINKTTFEKANISFDEITLHTENIKSTTPELLKAPKNTANKYSFSESLEILTESKNKYNKIKRNLVNEFYTKQNTEFLKNNNIYIDDDVLLTSTPFISNINLSKEQILSLLKNDQVLCIEESVDVELESYGYVNSSVSNKDPYKIIRGNIAVSEGYTGNGLRVGIIDKTHVDKTYFGSNVIYANTGTTPIKPHPSIIANIIFAMAPECSIYSYSIGSGGMNDVKTAINYLINSCNVDVISISIGMSNLSFSSNKTLVGEINNIIKNKEVNICIAAGNIKNGQTAETVNMNILGYTDNAITVGAVSSSGTAPSQSSYTLTDYSLYKQEKELINKPDICAPEEGYYKNEKHTGTSYSTPYVAGTIIQMLSRNPWMPQQSLKAAVLASAAYKDKDFKSDIDGTVFSTKSGAGVIDAYFCLKVAGNGRRTEHTFTSTGTWKTNVYADYATKPFRIAITWNVAYDSNYKQINPEINLRLTKNGKVVAHSTANSNVITGSAVPELDYGGPCTNYEVIELSPDILKQYGAGTYELTIYHAGSYKGPVTVGAAWEQW